MKKLIGLFVFSIITLGAYAQNYNTAGGIRISDGIGVTVQQRIADKLTVEGVAQENWIFEEKLATTGAFDAAAPIPTACQAFCVACASEEQAPYKSTAAWIE